MCADEKNYCCCCCGVGRNIHKVKYLDSGLRTFWLLSLYCVIDLRQIITNVIETSWKECIR